MSKKKLTPEFQKHLAAVRFAAVELLYATTFMERWPCESNADTWCDEAEKLYRLLDTFPPVFVEPRPTRSRSKAKRGRGR